MRLLFDNEADAAYIYLKDKIRKAEVRDTIALNDDIILDFNKDKRLIGIEILSASQNFPKEALSKTLKSPSLRIEAART